MTLLVYREMTGVDDTVYLWNLGLFFNEIIPVEKINWKFKKSTVWSLS